MASHNNQFLLAIGTFPNISNYSIHQGGSMLSRVEVCQVDQTRFSTFSTITLAKSWQNPARFSISKSTGEENWLQLSFLTSRILSSLYQVYSCMWDPFMDGSIRKPNIQILSSTVPKIQSFLQDSKSSELFPRSTSLKQTRKHKKTLTKSNLEDWKTPSWNFVGQKSFQILRTRYIHWAAVFH